MTDTRNPSELDRRLRAMAGRPWERLDPATFGAASKVPTMLTPQEQSLYYWLAAHWAHGGGAIVDLGAFAGGSTARLAEGLRACGTPAPGGPPTIHAFDRFTADDRAKRNVLYEQGIAPFEGNDILPLAQRLLAPWAPGIAFHRGEIEQMVWSGGPIEILVMDASKTARTGDAMAAIFFPHLVAGQSLVVHQDFLHWCQPWVPAQMERLAGYFRPVAHAPRDTVVFLCERAPDAGTLAAARVGECDDAAIDSSLAITGAGLAHWGLADRLSEMRDALAANPGRRRAFEFRRP